MIKIMTINDQIRDEKLQHNINRETAKISALSSGNIQKYEYLTGEDILPSNQQQIIEQAKFTYSPLGKAFEKQIKTIEDQGKKQVEALNTLKSNNQLTTEDAIPKNALNNDEAKKELNKIKEIEKNVDREKFIYETNEYIYIVLKIFKQQKLLVEIFMRVKLRLQKLMIIKLIYQLKSLVLRNIQNKEVKKKKQEKEIVLKNLYTFFEGREKVLDAFESKIFSIISKGAGILNPNHSKLKVLTPK